MTRFNNWKPPKIEHGKPTIYGWTVWRPEKFKLGKNVDIGALSQFFAHNGIEIQDDVQIGGGVFVYSSNTIDGTGGPVVIEEGAKIGAMSLIFPNVVIGRGAVIGAQSLVKRSVMPGAVVYGTPARSRKHKNKGE